MLPSKYPMHSVYSHRDHRVKIEHVRYMRSLEFRKWNIGKEKIHVFKDCLCLAHLVQLVHGRVQRGKGAGVRSPTPTPEKS